MSAPVEPTALDRALHAFRVLVRSVFPMAVYWIVHEYSVAESDGLTFSGTPTDATFSPQLPVRVPYSPALAGSSSVVPAGTLAYVGFANADPSKPFLVRFGAGATSTSTTIDATSSMAIGASAGAVTIAGGDVTDATGLGRVVRYGDPIVFGAPGPGTVSPGLVLNHFSKVKA